MPKNFFRLFLNFAYKNRVFVLYPLRDKKTLTCSLKTEYTFNRYIKKYEPSSPVAKAYAEFAKEVSADGRKKERLHSTDAR